MLDCQDFYAMLRDADVRYERDYRPSDPFDVSAWEQSGIEGAQ